ncbi:MAG: acyl-CoA dehydrogenase family protein [Mycobacterium sp.]
MATIEFLRTSADEVLNQAPPFPEANLFELDLALQEGLARADADWGTARVRDIGALAGSKEAREHARRAELHPPQLHTHDSVGHRIDEVECNPSWHWLLAAGVQRGVSSLPWTDRRPDAHAVRAALGYLWGQLNTGVMCPMIMTFAAVPVLQRFAPADIAEKWVPRLTLADYQAGALAGQAFTERQGGSDVRRITTTAVPAGDGSWVLDGHKWFCSAPMCDVFLTIAKTPAGLSCFLVERGDGFRIVRLKDKLGTRSLPSAEIEFCGARGWLVGEDGRGMIPLIHNLSHARLGPAVSPEMRAALVQAIHHCQHRSAFGERLIDQPAMANVLADLAIESEGQTAALMYLSARGDRSPMNRIAGTVMGYWGCGRATGHIAEAMQCLGGNGYSEASGLPRLLRDAAVHPIWEGSGNVVALDILRVAAKEPEAITAFLDECAVARGADRRLDEHLDTLPTKLAALAKSTDPQAGARRMVEDLAVGFIASLLVRFSTAAVADAYCAGRLGPDRGLAYGTLPAGVDTRAIIDRALPG